MAIAATIYTIEIDLADSDRQVYETLALRVARHPSESAEYLVARVLAYAMEYAEGIEFSRGVSEPDEPAITIRDPTGAIRSWIEIGSPDAARLHKAAKLAPRVAVYTHKDVAQLLRNLAGERIHRAADVELYAIDRALLRDLSARLERRLSFSLAIAERELYISIGSETLNGRVVRHPIG